MKGTGLFSRVKPETFGKGFRGTGSSQKVVPGKPNMSQTPLNFPGTGTNQFHAFAICCTQGKWVLLDSDLSHPVEILDNIPIQMLGGMRLPYRLYKLHSQNPLTSPYMENKEQAFCLVHAFNMALGKQLITGNSVLSHAQNLENCLTARLNEVTIGSIAKNGTCSTPRLHLQTILLSYIRNFLYCYSKSLSSSSRMEYQNVLSEICESRHDQRANNIKTN